MLACNILPPLESWVLSPLPGVLCPVSAAPACWAQPICLSKPTPRLLETFIPNNNNNVDTNTFRTFESWPSLEFSKVCKTNAVEPWSESGERKPPLTMLYLFPTSWGEITLKLFCHIPSISSGKLPWARFQPVDCPFSRLFLGPKDRSFSYPF